MNGLSNSGELMRVRSSCLGCGDWETGWWAVELYSEPVKRWMVVGEHGTREAALADMKSWGPQLWDNAPEEWGK